MADKFSMSATSEVYVSVVQVAIGDTLDNRRDCEGRKSQDFLARIHIKAKKAYEQRFVGSMSFTALTP